MRAAASALLGDVDMANHILSRCTEEQREEFRGYPIAHFLGENTPASTPAS